jgi:type IV pilus assembly protein PilO
MKLPLVSPDRIKLILSDFRNLNPKDIGAWPLAPRLLVLAVLFVAGLAAGWWFVWNDQLAELDAARQKEVALKQQYLEKKKQAVNLDLYIQQLNEVETSFGALLKQLPNKTDVDTLLVEINQAGLGRGLQFELFRPGAEIKRDFYAELPVTLKVTGSYHDLGAFAADIGRLSRIVTLNNMSVAPAKGAVLTMDATARTFRYLDEEEIAAARREEAQARQRGGRRR